jgi:transcriptional regulator with XRE-family HTH domain
MKARNAITICREKLGITQQALAAYLQVSRSLLNMAERGQRALPTQAFLQLTQLISHYEAATPAPLSPERSQQEKQQRLKLLDELVKETVWQLSKCNHALARMEADYQQTLCQIQTFQTMGQQLATDPNQPAGKRQQLWLSLQEAEAWQQLEKNSPVSRMPLQLKIVALQACLQAAQQLMHTLVSGD